MNSNYKVVYSGVLKAGTDPEKFVTDFMRIFKAPESHARKMIAVGRPVTLKDNLDQATAEKYRAGLDKLGMQVSVEPMIAAAMPIPATPVPAQQSAGTGARCPKCGSSRVQDDDCLACGIIITRYKEKQARLAEEPAAPQADAKAAAQDAAAEVDGEAEVMSGPHGVAAGNGWQWIAQGWGYFRRNPFAWLGALLVWILMILGSSQIPILGSLLVNLFAPVVTAGLMLGANEQRKGGDFEFSHLFAGFSSHTGPLVMVGVFTLIGSVLVVLIGVAVFTAMLYALGGGASTGGYDMQTLLSFGGSAILGLLVMLLLFVPLTMAYWFAPALVVLDGFSPFGAMKVSFSACLKNILPFLIYGLIMLVLLVIASIPLGLGLLVLMPVMMATIYTAYRDIFYQAN